MENRFSQFIVDHTKYLVYQLQHVTEILLKPDGVPGLEGFKPEAITLIGDDLERFAPQWGTMVPNDPVTCAIIAHDLAQSFDLFYQRIPNIRTALELDSKDVQSAFEERYGVTIQEVTKDDAHTIPRQANNMFWLDDIAAARIARSLDWVQLNQGDVLFEEGDPGDALYVVINGTLGAVDAERNITKFGCGELVGELEFITGDERTSFVYALRDSEVVQLRRNVFQQLNNAYPKMMFRLPQMVVERTRDQIDAHPQPTLVPTVALVRLHDTARVSTFITHLHDTLTRSHDILFLTPETLDQHLYVGASQSLQNENLIRPVVSWMTEQEALHDMVVYEVDPTNTIWLRRVLRQVDKVLLLADASQSPEVSTIEQHEILSNKPQFMDIELVLLHADKSHLPTGTMQWLEPRDVMLHHHVAVDTRQDAQRVARHLTGRSIGVVFSGGAARGHTYAGVIRAIREMGLPVDVVGGTSAGSVAATVLAMQQDIEQVAQHGIAFLKAFSDKTLPLVSLMSGKRLHKALIEAYGDIQIEDLWLPFVCVSTNATQCTQKVHRTGSLWRAIRASTSVPGVLPPVLDNHGTSDVLVDGGVLNNLPVDVVAARCNGPIIAVDSTNREAEVEPYVFDDYISGWRLLFNRLNPFKKSDVKAPTMAKFLSRLTSLSSLEERERQFALADVIINPPLERFGFFAEDERDAIAEVGYRAAKEVLTTWLAARKDLHGEI